MVQNLMIYKNVKKNHYKQIFKNYFLFQIIQIGSIILIILLILIV